MGLQRLQRRPLAVLKENVQEPIIALVRRCHEELRATRGVVMSAAAFNVEYGLMTWQGWATS